eukprot:m.28867 g.28867  ORF g.28867 m.28867 type:complete len:166 (-) comp11889_c0_seq3:829-1326(-)
MSHPKRVTPSEVRFWACDACRHRQLHPSEATRDQHYTKRSTKPLSWWDCNGYEDLVTSSLNVRPPPRLPTQRVDHPYIQLSAKLAGCQALSLPRHKTALRPISTQVDLLNQAHPALQVPHRSKPLLRYQDATDSHDGVSFGRRRRLHARLEHTYSNILARANDPR